ncbi:MAG TPA: hypothetical protein P5218_02270 [Planctomycetota bacterium]|nr:hypothetical protein [Planctomycetota bacterium]
MQLQAFSCLLSLLLAPAPHIAKGIASPADTHPLVWALPDDVLMAVSITDPSDLVQRRAESSWIQFLSDPRWIPAIESMVQEAMEEEVDVQAQAARATAILAGLNGLVAWIPIDMMETDEFAGGLVARGSDEALDLLQAVFLTATELEAEEDARFGQEDGVCMRRQGSLLGLYWSESDPDAGHAALRQAFEDLLQSETGRGPFELPSLLPERIIGDAEVVVPIQRILEVSGADLSDEGMPGHVVEEFLAVGWAYGTMQFGKGEAVDQTLVLSIREGGLIERFLGCLEAPDAATLARLPLATTEMSAGKLDLNGVMDLILEIATEIEPEASTQWDTMVDTLAEQMGFHLVVDLIDNFTGQVLTFSTGLEFLGSGEDDEVAMQATTIVMDLNRPKDFEETMGRLIQWLGPAFLGEDAFVHQLADWGPTWSLDPEFGLDMQVGVDSKSMVFSSQPAGLDAYLALKESGERKDSILADKGFLDLTLAFQGQLMQASNTQASFETLGDLVSGSYELGMPLEDNPMIPLLEVAGELGSEYFHGWAGSSLEVDKGRMRILYKAR